MNKKQIIETVRKSGLDVILTNGAALVMLGYLKETNDIDVVVNKNTFEELKDLKWKDSLLGGKITTHKGLDVHYDNKEYTYYVLEGIKILNINEIVNEYDKLYSLTKKEKYKEKLDLLKNKEA